MSSKIKVSISISQDSYDLIQNAIKSGFGESVSQVIEDSVGIVCGEFADYMIDISRISTKNTWESSEFFNKGITKDTGMATALSRNKQVIYYNRQGTRYDGGGVLGTVQYQTRGPLDLRSIAAVLRKEAVGLNGKGPFEIGKPIFIETSNGSKITIAHFPIGSAGRVDYVQRLLQDVADALINDHDFISHNNLSLLSCKECGGQICRKSVWENGVKIDWLCVKGHELEQVALRLIDRTID